jgi:hypothetical protein
MNVKFWAFEMKCLCCGEKKENMPSGTPREEGVVMSRLRLKCGDVFRCAGTQNTPDRKVRLRLGRFCNISKFHGLDLCNVPSLFKAAKTGEQMRQLRGIPIDPFFIGLRMEKTGARQTDFKVSGSTHE